MNNSHHPDSYHLAENMLRRLDAWVRTNGWAGYDPYDIRGLPWMIWIGKRRKHAPFELLERIVNRGAAVFPGAGRFLFRVKPRVNAKAMGLFARAYTILHRLDTGVDYADRAAECFQWLRRNMSPGYSGAAWGYPFDWASRKLIPQGTPSSVVTCTAGDAFRTAWLLSGDPDALNVCKSVGRFLTKDLNRARNDKGHTCFSYTPVDDFQVHNANLMVAEFLVWLGKTIDDPALLELGASAGYFALDEQNDDGSLDYWSRAQRTVKGQMDHYHTGFEMRALCGLWRHTGDEAFLNGLKRYDAFYRKHYLEPEGDGLIPRFKPGSTQPVDIHSCAEALILNTTLAPHFPQAAEPVAGFLRWIAANMQTTEGWFIYRLWDKGHLPRREVIPYLRWGQAWMMLALALCLKHFAEVRS
ncbi:MAG: hypothetical protein QNK37_31065 [Acidobacteriota bacterium]|nr:hypothetical protein [Acidobacteriota bacterium]